MAMLGIWAVSLDSPDKIATAVIVAVLTVALAVLSVVPWRRALITRTGDWIIVVWCAVALLVIVVYESTASGVPHGTGYLLVVVFAGGTLIPNRSVIAIGAGAAIAYATVLSEAGAASFSSYADGLLPFIAATVFVLLMSVGVRQQVGATDEALQVVKIRGEKLARKEQELTHLYEVSRTIGAGSQLDEVLPELIGRIAEAVNARIGLVLLYDFDSEHLELLSPIWVSGHTVPADPLSLGLDEQGIAQRVFMSGDAALINDTAAGSTPDRLTTELEAERVALVAMRVEHRTIGVLLVGDKSTDFTTEDIETLESVAAPAALVLSQMARFEEAKSTGERMAELAQLKTDFVSVVSHELRTPLTSIIGAISTLQRPELLPDDPRAQQLIEMAGKQANRLKTLIEDLLVMSRIDAELLPVRPEPIELKPFLAEVIEMVPDSDRVGLNVTPETISLVLDDDHLRRVMTNLIDNALKYGGDKSDVLVQATIDDEQVRVSIIDHGKGISYEQRDLIFERFTQLQPHATRSKGGAGLGLSIVKGLVLAMDGNVWFEPTPGGGATFVVALPLAKDEQRAQDSVTPRETDATDPR